MNTNKLLGSLLGAVMALLLSASSAQAQGRGHENDSAPEFGVAAIGTVVVLLAGGGILVARRRRR
jgi:LPXTG-motif cell wall-anchored protein